MFKNHELLNQIRENATQEYKDRIPFVDENMNELTDDEYYEMKEENK